jgi:hypothetical protein
LDIQLDHRGITTTLAQGLSSDEARFSARHSFVDFSELTIAALRVELNNRVITWPLIAGQVNRVTTVLLSFDSVEYIGPFFLGCGAADPKAVATSGKVFSG